MLRSLYRQFLFTSRLVLWAVLAMAAVGCAPRLETPPAPAGQPVPITAPVEAAPAPLPPEPDAVPPPVCRRLSVAAVGDIMLGTDFPEDMLPENDGRGLLAGIASELQSADVTFGNLEGVLMDGGEPVKKCQDPSLCYLFRSPARYAFTLKDAGFDVMSLANNHARDFGEPGRSASMAALDRAGILHSGRAGDVASWREADLRLAMIAFSFTSGSHALNDTEGARELVAQLAAGHDIVMVSFHGGAEGGDATHVPFTMERAFGEERGDLVKFSRTMVEAGADIVIGHGPHVPRGMEVYNERLIAYSLGNFATYFGISITGMKGYAPILQATLDGDGRLLEGRIVSGIQVRPDGVQADGRQRAFHLMQDMTTQDFSGGGLLFDQAGGFRPAQAAGGACGAGP